MDATKLIKQIKNTLLEIKENWPLFEKSLGQKSRSPQNENASLGQILPKFQNRIFQKCQHLIGTYHETLQFMVLEACKQAKTVEMLKTANDNLHKQLAVKDKRLETLTELAQKSCRESCPECEVDSAKDQELEKQWLDFKVIESLKVQLADSRDQNTMLQQEIELLQRLRRDLEQKAAQLRKSYSASLGRIDKMRRILDSRNVNIQALKIKGQIQPSELSIQHCYLMHVRSSCPKNQEGAESLKKSSKQTSTINSIDSSLMQPKMLTSIFKLHSKKRKYLTTQEELDKMRLMNPKAKFCAKLKKSGIFDSEDNICDRKIVQNDARKKLFVKKCKINSEKYLKSSEKLHRDPVLSPMPDILEKGIKTLARKNHLEINLNKNDIFSFNNQPIVSCQSIRNQNILSENTKQSNSLLYTLPRSRKS